MMEFIKSFSGVAIIDKNEYYTYDQLSDRVSYYVDVLENYKNANIAVISEFSFESSALFLAFSLNKNFNTFIPITPTSDFEILNKLKISKANFVFTYSSDSNSFIVEKCESNEKSLVCGVLLFSSGTTGVPKMMFHDFANLTLLFSTPSKRQRNIRILLFLMFDHIGGINTFLNCLKDGSTMVIPELRSVDHIVGLIDKYEVNILPTTPTFLNLLLININSNFHLLKSLKLISYGTERMPQQVLLKLRQYLPSVKLLQTFGTSETGILKTISKSSDSVFFKIEDDRYEYKIVNSILYIRSTLSVKGYVNLESDKFDSDGWYETGDIIVEDSDGYLKIVGRVNEVINVGGLKVMPIEVENVIMGLNFVEDCLVFGENNPISGQMVSTKIVLDNLEVEKSNIIDLKKHIKFHCKDKLDKFKVPARIEFVEKLSVSSRFKKSLS
jgi:acyl-coenzyme A synthetase/AMP-(fatty) acid ligase